MSGWVRTPGELTLCPRAVEIQDLVVLSLLFQEKQRRVKCGGREFEQSGGAGLNDSIALSSAFSRLPSLDYQ